MPKKSSATPKLQNASVRLAADLSHETRCVEEETLNSEVYRIFEKHPKLHSLPVTDKNRVVGLINRDFFMTQMAGRFHWEIYSKKRCSKMMEETPLVIEADTPIPEVAGRLLEAGSPNILVDSFVIARDGQLLGIGYTSDVMAVLLGQEQEAAAELRRHHQRLTAMVEERTHDLLQAKLAAEQAYRAKSDFLANISHELRTPLHAVLAFSRMGLEKAADIPRDKLARYFKHVVDSAYRLSELVQELLDMSALDAGNAQMKSTSVDICQLTEQVIADSSALAANRQITLENEARTESAFVIGDPERLSQVLRNVVGNAIKYSPPASQVRIQSRWKYAANADESSLPSALVVHVVDHGPGIPEGELERIFERFTQSSATHTGAGGKGLGLAISREIMRLHGGSITARNNPEGGACFVIEFPVTPGT